MKDEGPVRPRGERPFRWRGAELSRFEGFSDAVFAFAITLLVVSLEVPKTFDELLVAMRGFVTFAVCFSMLLMVWYRQHTFFRRYGLEDLPSIVLNAVLLFLVLFYVYPLKFLFTLLTNQFLGLGLETRLPGGSTVPMIHADQAPQLMLIYDLGFVAVFVVFALLYHHAYRLRDRLGLDPLEALITRQSIEAHFINVGVGVVSMVIAALGGPERVAWAGWSFFLLAPAHTAHGTLSGVRRRRLEQGSSSRPGKRD